MTLPTDGATGPVDYERLATVFMEPDAAMPRRLMHSAGLIHEMANESAMSALLDGARQRGVELEVGDDPDPADVAVQLWLYDPNLLEELHQLDRPRGFVHFVTDRDPVPAFQVPEATVLRAMETELGEAFFKAKRGRNVRVWMYRRPGELWFLLRHGLSSRRQEVVSEDGSGTLIFRPEEYDVMVYNSERSELRVHRCNTNEVEILRRAFGNHLFGDPEFFPGGEKFTLAPLLTSGRASLACRDIPGIETITLTEVQMFIGGRDWLRVTYQAPDLFRAIERGDIVLPEPERLVRASFLVRFSDSKKQRTIRIAGSNKLCVVRDGDTALMERWLEARGFVLADNRKAAAEFLKVPYRSFYDRVDKWSARGKDYVRMARWIEWRKASSRKIKLRLEDSVQSGEPNDMPENPETVSDVLATISAADNRDYPKLLADVMQTLKTQNPKNWAAVRDELVDMLKEEVAA